MPLTIESAPFRPVTPAQRERRHQRGTIRDRGRRLRIGLVNNMPDSALHQTERQFARLMEDAAGEFDVRLTLVALDTVPRAAELRAAIADAYRDPRQLRLASPDALIFTGAEPRAPVLSEEPFWDELTGLMDWSRGGVVSSLYSCLAAHVAAFHRDGVLRRRMSEKLSGVFQSEVVANHELTRGLARMVAPHSRYNALPEADLELMNYLILARSDEVGADVFVREKDMLEVFWQGHPEYDRDTLAREYRRDILRFLRGERATAPRAPDHFFDPSALIEIEAAIEGAAVDLDAVAAALNPEALSPATAPWREAATQLMSNWLAAVARRRAQRRDEDRRFVRFGG